MKVWIVTAVGVLLLIGGLITFFVVAPPISRLYAMTGWHIIGMFFSIIGGLVAIGGTIRIATRR